MATTNKNYPLRNVSSPYGAPMGRRDTLPDNPAEPVRLSVVALGWVDYDYDNGGAYWGGKPGTAIYRAVGESDSFDCVIELFVRAGSRTKAKDMIRQRLPNATFYR